MKSYFNQKGEEVIIAEMADAYLLNSLAFYKKRVEGLRNAPKHEVGKVYMIGYIKELDSLVTALQLEVKNRGIL